jgi:hypothetical protein
MSWILIRKLGHDVKTRLCNMFLHSYAADPFDSKTFYHCGFPTHEEGF